jgi:hypothetical protein
MVAIAISLDKLANHWTGGRRDMTISARLGATCENGQACTFARALAFVLDRFERDHCRNAWRWYRATRDWNNL